MFRFLLRRKSARRLALSASFAIVAAVSLPSFTRGVGAQDELQPRTSGRAAMTSKASQANIIKGAEFVPGEALVRFRTEAAAKGAEVAPTSLRAGDGEIDVNFARFEGSDIVRGLRLAKVDPARTLEAVAELAARPDVLYAEPNYIWRTTRTPNDPRFGEMHGLNRIGAPAAWDVTTGSGDVVVGVIDTGIDVQHEDLRQNIWTNPGEVAGNGADDDGNGFIDDVNGWDFSTCARSAPQGTICGNSTVYDSATEDDHGTHVAGTIGARGDNNTGVTGINWDVRLMSIKVLGADGGSVSNIIRGYDYALKMRQRGVNLRVLNNSYGGPSKSLSAFDAILQLNQAGILFVVAAGNERRDNFNAPEFPSNYDAPNVIAVAATTRDDALSSFSNFSSRLVSIGAPGGQSGPGQGILSTTPNNTYSFFSGTSMSSPHVAGAAALVCAARPDITLSQLRGALVYTGDLIPALQERTTTGRRLNVFNAIRSAQENDTTAPAPAGNLRVASQSGRSLTLAWTAPGDDGNSGLAADYDFFFINPTTGGRTLLPTTLAPAPAGTQQSATIDAPFLNFSGTVQLRTYDNAGNRSDSNVSVTIPVNSGSDPYTVTTSGAQPLSSEGTALPVTGDDKYFPQPQFVAGRYTFPGYDLPFSFPFYGQARTKLTISTNGTLYFSNPPTRDDGDADDAGSSIEGLQGQTMIAGLWDDVDINPTLRPGSGVYVVRPDAGRVIFRWQGVTFSSPRVNMDFEIELRIDGTIQMRYGENPRAFPVVGVSGGEPDAYVVASHTSETLPINLTNAPTVTFAVRPAVSTFSLSGQVTGEGTGLSGVILSLSGSQTRTTTTDASGNYSFGNLPAGGAYTLMPSRANYSFTPSSQTFTNLSGNQSFNFTASRVPVNVGFSASGYQFSENDGLATIVVTRSGDTSGAVSVDFITVDNPAAVPCDPAARDAGGNLFPQSVAYARCDYATTVETLTFAPGEISKTLRIPLINDVHTEGNETFQLELREPQQGAVLGAQATATVTLVDDDTAASTTNPINQTPFFVRQQYLDFLSREPEAAEPWSGVLNRCPDVFNLNPNSPSAECDRILVSQSFFGSPEFRLKGFFVFLYYKASFGSPGNPNYVPLYDQIAPDLRRVTGQTPDEVFAKRTQFSTNWVNRPAFSNLYPAAMANAMFVERLLANVGITLTTPDSVSGATRNSLVADLDQSRKTRAEVLRLIVESNEATAIQFNRAFVAIQYYGYLRRTPEPTGYQGWLDVINNPNVDQRTRNRTMINGFLNSAEYRLRFGPNILP